MFLDWITEGTGGGEIQFGIQNTGGISALNFQRGKTVKASLEIPDLIAFTLVNHQAIDCRNKIETHQARCYQSRGKVSRWVV